MAHESCAMLDGDLKYGFRNWRQKDVVANIYIDAALRHLQQWSEGEEYAEDSGVHHLGHARACLGILLDAQANGNLIDNRAKGVFGRVQAELSAWVAKRIQKAKDDDAAKEEKPAIEKLREAAGKLAYATKIDEALSIPNCFTKSDPALIYAPDNAVAHLSGKAGTDKLNYGTKGIDAIGPEVKKAVSEVNAIILPKKVNAIDSDGGGDR
jgi:hypothetical protein